MMADGRGRKFSCLKYFLMSSNAFGLMIGIFLVLFGMAYPDENFPGGYKGRETAGIAGVFIFFTLIGYCGAHHQKIYFLLLYSVIILIFIGGNIILWGIQPEISVLDPESRTVYVVGGLFLVLMVIGVILSWQIRRASHPRPSDLTDSTANVNLAETSSIENMTIITAAAANQLQQQQQQQHQHQSSSYHPQQLQHHHHHSHQTFPQQQQIISHQHQHGHQSLSSSQHNYSQPSHCHSSTSSHQQHSSSSGQKINNNYHSLIRPSSSTGGLIQMVSTTRGPASISGGSASPGQQIPGIPGTFQ